MTKKLISLPTEMRNNFFFPTENIEWEESYSIDFQPQVPFIHEIGHYATIPGIKPWEMPEQVIPMLLEEWNQLNSELRLLLKKRKLPITSQMKASVALFLEFLFWSNLKPVKFPLKDLASLKIKPVNIEDRIHFILSRPNLYHSYSQLVQLMTEQEKHYLKSVYIIKPNVKNVQE